MELLVVVYQLLLLLPVIMVNKSIQNTHKKFRILMNTLACQSSKKNNSWIWKREKWNKEENGHKNWFIFPKILSILHWKLNEEFGILEFTKTAVFAEFNQKFGVNFGQPFLLRLLYSRRRRKHFHFFENFHHPPVATPWSGDPALRSRLFSVCRTGVVLRTRSKRIVRPGLTLLETR